MDREREADAQGVLDLGLPVPSQRRPSAASLPASSSPPREAPDVPARGASAPGASSASVPEESDDVLDSDLPERVVPAQRSGLGEREERILEFERQWWKHAGAKEQAIRETFEVSSTRYYQILNRLLDDPRALAFDPALVNRLRRLRMSRARSRA